MTEDGDAGGVGGKEIPGHPQKTRFWKIRGSWVSRSKAKRLRAKILNRPQLGFRKSLRETRMPQLRAGRRAETRPAERAGPRGAGRTVGGACCHSPETPPLGPPPALPLEGVGGGSEGHPPLATGPRPVPCPPTPSALPGASEHQERKHRDGHRAPGRRKGGPPPATKPVGLVTSPGVELCGSAPEAGASAPTSESAAPAGRGEAAALCRGSTSQSAAVSTPHSPLAPHSPQHVPPLFFCPFL